MNPKNPKLKKIIVTGIVVAILVTVGGICANNWVEKKMAKVELGLSNPDFPYRDYTEAELNKMYPQVKYADVETRTTPEETYAKFRQALNENNLEMAIEQLGKESKKYSENVEDLTKAYQELRFGMIYQNYPEKILQEDISESLAQFYFNYKENDTERTHFINFIKNSEGDWKLDSL